MDVEREERDDPRPVGDPRPAGGDAPSTGRPPRFSVVVPTYDRHALLREAVRSVCDQTVQDWECIVVDDASPTPVEPFDDPRVRLVRLDRNSGGAASINAGVAASRGEILTFLDDDDLWVPERLALVDDAIARAPIAICWSQHLDASRPARGRVFEGDCSDVILDDMAPSYGAAAVRREAWVDMREDLRTTFDTDWWLRVAQRVEMATVPVVAHLVRRHPGVRHLGGSEVRARDNRRMIADHRVWFDAHPRAEAFRLRRGALYASRIGDHRTAVRDLVRSFRLAPSARTAKQLGLALARRPRPDPD